MGCSTWTRQFDFDEVGVALLPVDEELERPEVLVAGADTAFSARSARSWRARRSAPDWASPRSASDAPLDGAVAVAHVYGVAEAITATWISTCRFSSRYFSR